MNAAANAKVQHEVCEHSPSISKACVKVMQDLYSELGQCSNVCMHAGEQISARSVVITTGTFLHGIIHVGSQTRPAGRMPSSAASQVQPQLVTPYP